MNPNKLAHGTSWVLHPFLLPLYFLTVLLTCTTLSLYPSAVKLYFLWVVVLYTILIPALGLVVLRKTGMLTDYRIDIRRERIVPLLMGAVCYVLCAITVARIPSADIIRRFMIAAAACEVSCLLVSMRWKISLHMTGMGALVAMLAVLNLVDATELLWPLAVAVLGAGALATARLYLGCHTPMQILAGFANGFLISLSVLLFL